MSEDPKGLVAGVNMYAYAGNNPENGNDPDGLQAVPVSTENGWTVSFNNVYFTGPGYTPAWANAYKTTLQTKMTNRFPPSGIKIKTIVNFAPDNKPVFGGIEVKIPRGNRVVADDGTAVMGTTQLSLGIPSVVVTLPERTNPSTMIHEGWFHALCPSCDYTGHNSIGNQIMNAYSGKPHVITSEPIEQALRGIGKLGAPASKHQEDESGSEEAAFGGYLIYPNKPNNNQLHSVYSKPVSGG